MRSRRLVNQVAILWLSYLSKYETCIWAGVILVAPDSRGETWDAVMRVFGPDVAYIDEALKKVFAQYNIDSSHMCLAGFSDGGTYVYSLGGVHTFKSTESRAFILLSLFLDKSPSYLIYPLVFVTVLHN